MSMRLSLLAPMLAAFLGAAGTWQADFTSGVWKGEASYDADGAFSDCTMTAQSDGNILLGFVISKDFDWGLVISDETRELDVGTTQAVLLFVDAREPFASVAKVIDVHGVLIPLENSDPVIEAMRQGKVLRIVTQGVSFSFELTGTNTAIAQLAACVTEHLGTEKVRLRILGDAA